MQIKDDEFRRQFLHENTFGQGGVSVGEGVKPYTTNHGQHYADGLHEHRSGATTQSTHKQLGSTSKYYTPDKMQVPRAATPSGSTWTCSVCAVHNSLSVLVCSGCNASRRQGLSDLPETLPSMQKIFLPADSNSSRESPESMGKDR